MINVSQKRHKVDELPEGLDIRSFTREAQGGIMDPQTITLYAPEQWTERFFDQEVNAQKHMIVLYSREGESYWLHTRGMTEFGRPDIGISGVPEGKVDAYKLIIDQMIYYGGLGLSLTGIPGFIPRMGRLMRFIRSS